MTVPPRRAVFLLLMLVPAAAAAAIVLAPREEPTSGTGSESAYERIVKDVFARGVLTVSHNPHARVVEVNDEDLRRTPVLRAYFERSYLRRDIERNDPRLWQVDGRLIGLAPGAHRIPSPFAPGSWHGDLALSAGRPSLTLAIEQGSRSLGTILLDPGISVAAAPRPNFVAVGRPVEPGPARSHLRLVRAGTTERLAEIRVLAGHAWVQSWAEGVAVDAAPLRPGEGRVLENGGTVIVPAGPAGAPVRVTLTRQTGTAISRWNGVGVRYRDEDYADLSEAVEAAMDAAVERCGENCPFLRRPVMLTLDRGLDRFAQSILDTVAGSHRRAAAVTVLDGGNGDILALATHAPEDAIAGPTNWSRQPRNYNLQPLAVGSTAKPLIAAAILAQRPELARLEIRATTRSSEEGRVADQIIGFDMKPPLGVADATPAGWIDLRQFLQFSSNVYAAGLMIMGIDDSLGPGIPSGGNYRFLGGNPQPFVHAKRLQAAGGGIYWLDSFPRWGRMLRGIFDVGDTRLGSNAETSVWRNLPGSLGLVSSPLSAGLLSGFEPLSPLRQDWALDQPSRFTLRESYVPIILGGEAYGWTTVGLAQGYARLVTGSRVSARIVASSGDQPRRGALLADASRQMICEGMAGVAEAGTATREPALTRAISALRREAAGSTIGFFSKTGTPEIDRLSAQQERLVALEDQLLASGRIRPSAGKLAILERSGKLLVPTASSDRARAQQALASQGVDRTVAARAAARVLAFNRGDTNAYHTSDGVPTRVPRPAPAQQEFGHAYVFVVTVHRDGGVDPHNCLAAPAASFAIAINVQEPEDKTAALRIAARLLEQPSPLRDRILAASRPPRKEDL